MPWQPILERPGPVWSSGDFNFDGTVNTADFAAIGVNFNAAACGLSGRWVMLVPEPSSRVVALAAGLVLARRRR